MVREYDDMKLESVLRNFEQVLKTKDSSKIGKQLYKCLNVYCGFIAHYDIRGFRETYQDLRKLVGELLRGSFGWGWDMFLNNKNSYLYDTKHNGVFVADFLSGLLELARQYENEIGLHFRSVQECRELAAAEKLADKLGMKLVPKDG